MQESVFRKESLKKITSPEELNDYIKVSRPSVWIVIAAAIVLLVSVFIWGVTGSLETSVSAKAVEKDGKIICYIPDVSTLAVGDSVVIGDTTGVVEFIPEKPVSYDRAAEGFGDDEYTVYSLGLSEWNYEVEISAKDYKPSGDVVTVKIVTENISPLSFLWN